VRYSFPSKLEQAKTSNSWRRKKKEEEEQEQEEEEVVVPVVVVVLDDDGDDDEVAEWHKMNFIMILYNPLWLIKRSK
jgi:hypothetical protein